MNGLFESSAMNAMEELLNRAGTTDYRHGSGSEVADRGEGRYGDTGTGLPVPRRKCQMITIFGYCRALVGPRAGRSPFPDQVVCGLLPKGKPPLVLVQALPQPRDIS